MVFVNRLWAGCIFGSRFSELLHTLLLIYSVFILHSMLSEMKPNKTKKLKRFCWTWPILCNRNRSRCYTWYKCMFKWTHTFAVTGWFYRLNENAKKNHRFFKVTDSFQQLLNFEPYSLGFFMWDIRITANFRTTFD